MQPLLTNFIAVACGGAMGSCLRYGISLCYSGTYSLFAIPTFTVNIIGSLSIGLLFVYAPTFDISPALRAFLFVGLLGGFTTFSSFSLECVNMLRNGYYAAAAIYISASNVAGILSALGGVFIGNKIIRFFA